ncbi:MAG: glycosyltransferase [Candidatus Paceibacterota bacterium]
MNVLFIGTTDILGGAAVISWEIKKALEKSGHSVSFFVADKRSQDPAVTVIPKTRWRKVLDYILNTESFVNTDWIIETEQFKKADLVHCHNLHGRFFNLRTLEKMSKLKPVVWTLHDEWAITPHCACTLQGEDMKYGLYTCPSKEIQPKILWPYTKHLAEIKNSIYRQSKLHIVTPSHWLSERVKKTILGKQPTYLIPNGIDINKFTKTPKALARETLNLPPDKKIILFLAVGGKDNPWKGWTYAEELIKNDIDKKDRLYLNVGNLDSLSYQAGNCLFRPKSTPEETALYFSAADALLFTSVAENFPLVILEAMSCGLPIVSFDVGGVKEVLVHKENGYIAKYKDPHDLQIGLDYIMSLTPAEIEHLAKASAVKIRTSYNLSLMTTRYIDLYQTIIQNNDAR